MHDEPAIFISGPTWASEVLPNEVAVVYAPKGTPITAALDDPADNPRMSVADAYEQLTWLSEEPEDLPDFDLVEELGFNGTTGRVTWKQIARRLLELRAVWLETQGESVTIDLTRMDLDMFAERMDDIEDDEETLIETVFDFGGARIRLS